MCKRFLDSDWHWNRCKSSALDSTSKVSLQILEGRPHCWHWGKTGASKGWRGTGGARVFVFQKRPLDDLGLPAREAAELSRQEEERVSEWTKMGGRVFPWLQSNSEKNAQLVTLASDLKEVPQATQVCRLNLRNRTFIELSRFMLFLAFNKSWQ